MLKGIDPKLNAEVLFTLRAMGHGDAIVVADANFPADQVSRSTVLGELLRMENITSTQAVESILSVLPLDDFVDDFAVRMEVVGEPTTIPEVQAEVQKVISSHDSNSRTMLSTDRFDFYERAKQSYAVIQTGERRFYGCFIIRKGVIPPNNETN